MAREWQQTKVRAYVLPDTVYYQTLWAVRDLERMEERIVELKEDIEVGLKGHNSFNETKVNYNYNYSKPTEDVALAKASLEERTKAIKEALSIVPDIYKQYVMNSVIYQINPKRKYPDNIWKIWKQRFLYTVALNLNMI
ncbi:MAG: hypothetical protein RR313_07005 [Anaerovoracaceae bacterium]